MKNDVYPSLSNPSIYEWVRPFYVQKNSFCETQAFFIQRPNITGEDSAKIRTQAIKFFTEDHLNEIYFRYHAPVHAKIMYTYTPPIMSYDLEECEK